MKLTKTVGTVPILEAEKDEKQLFNGRHYAVKMPYIKQFVVIYSSDDLKEATKKAEILNIAFKNALNDYMEKIVNLNSLMNKYDKKQIIGE